MAARPCARPRPGISAALFSGSLEALTEEDYAQLALDGMPSVALSREQSGLVDALVAAGLAKSKSEARTFISSGAVAVNGVKVTALDAVIGDADRRFGRYTVLQRGKKNHRLDRLGMNLATVLTRAATDNDT